MYIHRPTEIYGRTLMELCNDRHGGKEFGNSSKTLALHKSFTYLLTYLKVGAYGREWVVVRISKYVVGCSFAV